MNSIERFKKQKAISQKIESRHGLQLCSDAENVDIFLNSKIDFNTIDLNQVQLDAHYNSNFNIDVTEQEVSELLSIISNGYDENRFKLLVKSSKKEVAKAIAIPFGLGKFISIWDKDGGNVDTIHNVRQGIYATTAEKKKYDDRGDYNSHEYHSDKAYIDTNRQHKSEQNSGALQDAYTKETLDHSKNRNLDHVISAKEVHDDPARVLAGKRGVELANKTSNLKSTQESINKSKQYKSMDEFLSDLNKKAPQRKKRIHDLSNKNSLSAKEQKELNKLQQLDNIDHDKARAADKKARQDYDKELNQYYKSKKFVSSTAKTTFVEAGKIGIQQAIGLVVYEFFDATFDEIIDIYKHGFSNGFTDSRFLSVIKRRLSNIASRISLRWKDMSSAFAEGFISGLLSNLVTTVVNVFITTEKRLVRIIREGFLSIVKALKLLCFPPPNMSLAQAAHEASKIIAAALVTSIGIVLEQYIHTAVALIPGIGLFAGTLVSALVGAITGLGVTFVVYAIDRLDFFGVNEKEKQGFIMEKIEGNLCFLFAEADELIAEVSF